MKMSPFAIVVGILLLVALSIPLPRHVVKAVTIQLVDGFGHAVPGAGVEYTWVDFSISNIEEHQLFFSDSTGRVYVEGKTKWRCLAQSIYRVATGIIDFHRSNTVAVTIKSPDRVFELTYFNDDKRPLDPNDGKPVVIKVGVPRTISASPFSD